MFHKIWFCVASVPLAVRGVVAQAPIHYRVTVATETNLDMSQMTHGSQLPLPTSRVTNLTAFLSVTARDSSGGRLMRLKVDSMVGDLSAMMRRVSSTTPPELAGLAKSAIGEQITVLLVNGKRQYLGSSASMSIELGSISGALQVLLLSVPKGAAMGATWADTTATDTSLTVAEVTAVQKAQMVTVWNLATVDSITGTIDSKMSMLFKDPKSPGGTMTALGSGTAMVLLDATGITRRGTLELRSTMKMQVTAPGDLSSTSHETITVERVE